MEPGPISDEVLYDQPRHRSHVISFTEVTKFLIISILHSYNIVFLYIHLLYREARILLWLIIASAIAVGI